MFNRMVRVSLDFTRQGANRSAAWGVFARDTIRGFITTAHHALMALGVAAIGALVLMFVKPDFADQLKELSPFAQASEDEADKVPQQAQADEATIQSLVLEADKGKTTGNNAKTADNTRQQQWVTNWLAKRYRVATDATDMLVSAAYTTAREIKIDPLLILSVIAIESGFNPFAESPVGAQGLMQVMSKVHHDKFQELGGIKAALNPVANIRVGALILKDYVTRGGSVEAGLKLYVGAGALDSDAGYGARVLAEYHRLKDVANGKQVSIFTTSASAAPIKPHQQEKKADASPSTESTPHDADHAAPESADQVAAIF